MTGKPPLDRQREHQANERTFLAWIRTALAMIGIGLAIARFGLFLRQSQYLNNPEAVSMSALGTSEILGLGFILTGLILIPLAILNYGRISEQIETGNYTPNPLMVWLTAGLVMGLGVLSIPLLLLNRSPNGQQSPASYWREGIRVSLLEKPLEVLEELKRGRNDKPS